MRSFHTFIIAGICLCLGLIVFFYKSFLLDFPLLPNKEAESWHIETRLEFRANNGPVKVNLYLPRESANHSIVDESFISDGYGLTTKIEKGTRNRLAQWSKREEVGKEVLFYRAILYNVKSSTRKIESEAPTVAGLTYKDELFQQKAKEDPVFLALKSIIDEIYSRSADEKTFVVELLRFIHDERSDERIVRIRKDMESAKTNAGFISTILNYAAVPNRIMHGIALEESRREAALRHWVEYYAEGKWHVIHIKKRDGENYTLLPWWEGDKPFFSVEGGTRPVIAVSVKRHTESALTEAIWQGNEVSEFIHTFSVFSLPVHAQLVLQVLLMIPIGCLVSAVLRQVVGINTFGTFMPVLVALAFRETQLVWGIVFFTIIVSLGLIFRSYFDRLHLLMVPRLTAILTIVVLIIFVLSLISFKFGVTTGLSISLFPIVILTMVIERMTLLWEEHGAGPALKAAINSLLTAIIAYEAMTNTVITHLIVTFPELLFVVLAAALMLGRYNGYKLMEYRRFKVLRKS